MSSFYIWLINSINYYTLLSSSWQTTTHIYPIPLHYHDVQYQKVERFKLKEFFKCHNYSLCFIM